MSFAQKKQRQYVQLSQTIQHIVNELNVSRDLINETSRQISAMGKFGALHAAHMMAVETVETHFEETGGLPYSPDTTRINPNTNPNVDTDNTRERERDNNNNDNNPKTTQADELEKPGSVSG